MDEDDVIQILETKLPMSASLEERARLVAQLSMVLEYFKSLQHIGKVGEFLEYCKNKKASRGFRMNKKEARSIFESCPYHEDCDSLSCWKAEGYLEAIEKADQILNKIQRTCNTMDDNIYDAGGWVKDLKEHLKEWREIK